MEASELIVRILLSVHSVLAKLQPTATEQPRQGRFRYKGNRINILGPTKLLEGSRITEVLKECVSHSGEDGGRTECERCGGLQVFICVGGAALLPPGFFSC